MIRETAGNVDSDIITTSPMTVETEVGVLVASRGLMSGDVRVMSAMLAFCKFFVAKKISNGGRFAREANRPLSAALTGWLAKLI